MGGSSSNDATNEAIAAENRKQAEINASVGQIDQIFADPTRQAQYADFLAATRKLYGDELLKQQKENSRNLKFSLARSGNTGGSTAVDQGAQLGRDYNRGVVEADRMAQSDTANLKGLDQDARLRLIGMAQSGLDATTGIQNAQSALQSNLQSGQSTRNVKAVGDVFSNYTDIYKKSLESKATRDAAKYDYGTTYSPGWYTGAQQPAYGR